VNALALLFFCGRTLLAEMSFSNTQFHRFVPSCQCVAQENCASLVKFSSKQPIPILRLPNKALKHVRVAHWTALRAAV
jgi:hypothetical protein